MTREIYNGIVRRACCGRGPSSCAEDCDCAGCTWRGFDVVWFAIEQGNRDWQTLQGINPADVRDLSRIRMLQEQEEMAHRAAEKILLARAEKAERIVAAVKAFAVDPRESLSVAQTLSTLARVIHRAEEGE